MRTERRSTSVALMMALGLSLGLPCLVCQDMTPERMTSCAATDVDCQRVGATMDWCQSIRADQDILVEQSQGLQSPLALVSSAIHALVRPTDTYFGFSVARTTEVEAASPPKYILLGSFLI